jgi:hypothetical protein
MNEYETALPSSEDRHKVNDSVNYQLKTHNFHESEHDLCLDEAEGDIVTKYYNLKIKNKLML